MSRVCGLVIIDVTDGVADGHEESIVHEQVSDTRSRWVILGTARPMCSSDGTTFSSLKVPELMQTTLSMHAVLTVQWGC